MSRVSRRSVLFGSAVLGLSILCGWPGRAQVASLPDLTLPGRYSSVAVDVGPLRAQGLNGCAEFVRQALSAELQRAFADRLGGPGPALVVRITGLSLNSYAGSGQGTGGRGRSLGGSDNDYLDGEALVVGPRGAVLARHPQLSVVPASSGDAWYDPQSESRRVVALAQHYAGWLRRTLG